MWKRAMYVGHRYEISIFIGHLGPPWAPMGPQAGPPGWPQAPPFPGLVLQVAQQPQADVPCVASATSALRPEKTQHPTRKSWVMKCWSSLSRAFLCSHCSTRLPVIKHGRKMPEHRPKKKARNMAKLRLNAQCVYSWPVSVWVCINIYIYIHTYIIIYIYILHINIRHKIIYGTTINLPSTIWGNTCTH